MKEKFDMGGGKKEEGMLMHLRKKEVLDLRNEVKESPGLENKIVREETKFNFKTKTLKMKNAFLQNGDFTRKKMELKMNFRKEKVKIVHGDTNRWSGVIFDDAKIVLANQDDEYDARTEKPIKYDITLQLSAGRE